MAIASGMAVFFLLDRFLKYAALSLKSEETVPLISNFFSFRFTANYKIAFSLPLEGAWLSYVIFVILLILIFQLAKKVVRKNLDCEAIALGAIILGASSNLIDRLIYGYVIDYFEITYFTVFNLADVLISAGAIYLIVKALLKK